MIGFEGRGWRQFFRLREEATSRVHRESSRGSRPRRSVTPARMRLVCATHATDPHDCIARCTRGAPLVSKSASAGGASIVRFCRATHASDRRGTHDAARLHRWKIHCEENPQPPIPPCIPSIAHRTISNHPVATRPSRVAPMPCGNSREDPKVRTSASGLRRKRTSAPTTFSVSC
jgi:hypothetical protein